MSFMDRAKAAAEQVRARAQEGVEEVQARKEIAQGYWDLGHKAYELASAGSLSHPELDPLVQRMTELLEREGDGSDGAPATPGAGADTGPAAPGPASDTAPGTESVPGTGTAPPENPA